MEDIGESEQPLSKTRKKQLAKEVEQVAVQLAELPENQYAQLQLNGDLRREVELARHTRGRGSHKRQIKHLAGVLRKQDEALAALLAQLQGLDQVARHEKRTFHQLESLRDRLCAAESFDAAFTEMLDRFPSIDRKAISRLARSVHQYQDKRASREIFRRLRDAAESGIPTE